MFGYDREVNAKALSPFQNCLRSLPILLPSESALLLAEPPRLLLQTVLQHSPIDLPQHSLSD
jgi:hypothetical protein